MRIGGLALLLLSGCSFVFVHGPPRERAPDVAPQCTEFPIVPIVDLLGTMTAGAAVYRSQVAINNYMPDPDALPGTIAGGADFDRVLRNVAIVWGVVQLAATTYGFVQFGRCVSAKREYTRQYAVPQ